MVTLLPQGDGGMASKQILVTGGSGFVGSAIVKALFEKHPDWQVSVLDLTTPTPDVLAKLEHFFEVDITVPDAVNHAFASYFPDLVVHTAGIVPAGKFRYSTSEKDWDNVRRINYDGTRHVLEAAMASGCKHFVYTSSSTVAVDDLDHDYHYMDETVPLGFATLHYGRSKYMAEQYIFDSKHAEKGLVVCALRPCMIFGPGDTAVIPVMHSLIAKGETNFIVGNGDNVYDFLYIENAVEAHVLAIENLLSSKTAAGHAFFISNQEPIYFWDFLAAVWVQFGHVPSYKIHIPIAVALAFGALLEWYSWLTGAVATMNTGSVRDGMKTAYSNNSKAVEILGYKPKVGLAEGVRLACEDYKQILAAQARLLRV